MGRGSGQDQMVAAVAAPARRGGRAAAGVAPGATAPAAPRRPPGSVKAVERLNKLKGRVGLLTHKTNRALAAVGGGDYQTRERLLKDILAAPQQRELIAAAQFATTFIENHQDHPALKREVHEARKLSDAARQLYLERHRGFIMRESRAHQGRFHGLGQSDDRDDFLFQTALIGMNKGIDRYDPENGASPLTYTKNWIQSQMKEAAEWEGHTMRLKGSANYAWESIQRAAKELGKEGKPVTVAALAKKAKLKVTEVVELAEHFNSSMTSSNMVSLDAEYTRHNQRPELVEQHGSAFPSPIHNLNSGMTTGGADEQVADEATKQLLRERIATRPPLEQAVLKLRFGLDVEEPVDERDLFAGVYTDEYGTSYSAEPTVMKVEAERGRTVEKRSQRELNKMYAAGELSFRPSTPEAAYMLHGATASYTRAALDDQLEHAFTAEVGMPPTSGTVQELRRRGLEALREDPVIAELIAA